MGKKLWEMTSKAYNFTAVGATSLPNNVSTVLFTLSGLKGVSTGLEITTSGTSNFFAIIIEIDGVEYNFTSQTTGGNWGRLWVNGSKHWIAGSTTTLSTNIPFQVKIKSSISLKFRNETGSSFSLTDIFVRFNYYV